MSDEEMTVDSFLAGLNLDTDDTDEDTTESISPSNDDYGSVPWQLRDGGYASNPDIPYKIVDCIVYTFDPDTSELINPYSMNVAGKWMGEGRDPIWDDEEEEEVHKELKEKYNVNIKKKQGNLMGVIKYVQQIKKKYI